MDPDIKHALNVVWGVSELLSQLKSPYAEELRDAVVVIKDKLRPPGTTYVLRMPDSHYSTNHGGPRTVTRGIIIHGTRGGAQSGVEYDGTINWFLNPASQVSAHVVIAQDGRWSKMVADPLMAWHAGEHNEFFLGAELEQPIVGSVITTAQYITLAGWCKEMADKYGFDLNHDTIIEHKDTPQGIRLGKTDVGAPFSIDTLLAYIG